MIELKQVEKIFAETKAGLAPITLQIERGDWVTLLGASGSGKSTLLRLLANLEQKTAGTLTNPYQASEVSFVFQEAALLPWKTVLENVILPLTIRGMNKDLAIQKAEPWLKKLKIERFAQSYPSELSGGMKMRVSLARACVTEPKLLLLDEPFAALDEPIRIELGMELRSLWTELKSTVILVTHSITEGLWLANRVVVLQGQPGHIVLDEKLNLGLERTLELRANKEFTDQVERCFQLLKGASTV